MDALTFLESAGHYAHFLIRVLAVLPRSLGRLRELSIQLHRVFVGALPLAVVGGMAVGAVIWLHGRDPVRKVGGPQAETILPTALALVVVLELAPITAGLIVAGRSGASLGAELGSMRLTEQIDALEMLGLSPLRELVGPRVVACVLALPLLTSFVVFAALGAGLLAAALGGNMPVSLYLKQAQAELYLRDVVPALLKTAVFGLLIGVTGCYFGLQASGGTEGVGRAATRGVVLSIFLVLVTDVFMVVVIRLLSDI